MWVVHDLMVVELHSRLTESAEGAPLLLRSGSRRETLLQGCLYCCPEGQVTVGVWDCDPLHPTTVQPESSYWIPALVVFSASKRMLVLSYCQRTALHSCKHFCLVEYSSQDLEIRSPGFGATGVNQIAEMRRLG